MSANKVHRSIEATGGMVCVDIFQRPDESWGFEEYRRDPEDGTGWFATGFHAEQVFASPEDALHAAIRAVPWLEQGA